MMYVLRDWRLCMHCVRMRLFQSDDRGVSPALSMPAVCWQIARADAAVLV